MIRVARIRQYRNGTKNLPASSSRCTTLNAAHPVAVNYGLVNPITLADEEVWWIKDHKAFWYAFVRVDGMVPRPHSVEEGLEFAFLNPAYVSYVDFSFGGLWNP